MIVKVAESVFIFFTAVHIKRTIPLKPPADFKIESLLSQYGTKPFTLYIIQFDKQYDISGATIPAVIDNDSYIHDHSALKTKIVRLAKAHHHTPGYTLVLILLGQTPMEILRPFTLRHCYIRRFPSEFPYSCSLAFADEILMLLSSSNQAFDHSSFRTREYDSRGQRLLPLQLIWHDGPEVASIVILKSQGGTNASLPIVVRCSSEVNREAHAVYQQELAMPISCVIESKSYATFIPVESPFHNVTNMALSILGCDDIHFPTPPIIRVSGFLYSEGGGNYPRGGESMLLGPLTPALVMIGSEDLLTEAVGANPMIQSFDTVSWCIIEVVILLFGLLFWMIAACTWLQLLHVTLWVVTTMLYQFQSPPPSSRMAGKILIGLLLFTATVLNNLHQCGLNAEFAYTVKRALPLHSIHDAQGYQLYLIFDSKHCTAVRDSKIQDESFDPGYLIRRNIKGEGNECEFIRQLRLAQIYYPVLDAYHKELGAIHQKLERMINATARLKYNCTDQVTEIIDGPDWSREKSLILTSQENFLSVWRHVESSHRVRNNSLQFVYKLDSDASYFRVPTGIRIPSNLKASQVWVRRKLRAMTSSGLRDLWRQYEGRKAKIDNAKLTIGILEVGRQPKPIPLEDSWFLQVFQLFVMAFGVALAVFVAEELVWGCSRRREKLEAN